jgi:hypothetical protein
VGRGAERGRLPLQFLSLASDAIELIPLVAEALVGRGLLLLRILSAKRWPEGEQTKADNKQPGADSSSRQRQLISEGPAAS